MEPWGFVDLALFLACGLFLMLFRLGPIGVVLLVFGAIPRFTVWLPLKIFWIQNVRPFEDRTTFQRKASGYELYASEAMRWCLTNVNARVTGKVIFGKTVWLWMYNYRRLRYGTEDIGDTYYKRVSTDLYAGYWVKSESRGEDHDLVLFFVPGNGFGFASSYFYLEFAAFVLVSLQQQGFENPGIFVVDVNYRSSSFRYSVAQSLAAYQSIALHHESSTRVLMGSGAGATAVLSMMIHQGHSLKEFAPFASPPAHAALLLSPMSKLAKRRHDVPDDYVRSHDLFKFMSQSLDPQDSNKLFAFPGMMKSGEWWKRAIPPLGVHISCGSEEILRSETEEIYVNMRTHGKVILSVEPNQLHSWPIYRAYTARTKSERDEGITAVSSRIAQLALWQAATRRQNT